MYLQVKGVGNLYEDLQRNPSRSIGTFEGPSQCSVAGTTGRTADNALGTPWMAAEKPVEEECWWPPLCKAQVWTPNLGLQRGFFF